MSAQASGVLGVGVEPPPDSSDPSRQVATSVGSAATAPRSGWVICPTFSSRVIAASSRPARAWGPRVRPIKGRGGDGAAGPATEGAAIAPSNNSRQVATATRRMGRSTRRVAAPLVQAEGDETPQ
jgi:hypothetical protein